MKNSVRGLLLVTGGMIAGALISASLAAPERAARTVLPLDEIRQFTDIYGAVKQYYVDPVEDKKLMKEAISGMLQGLDPHSAYLDENAFNELQEGTTGEFGGLGLEVSSDPSGVKVISPIDDTPAARAHMRAGDIIFKIDGKIVKDLPLNDSVKMMRGKPDTPIELTVLRKGSSTPITVKLVRAVIKVKSVKSKPLDDHMGYIRVSQFQERTASELAKALDALNKSGNLKNGLVLDLRNDPGGLLNAAIGVSAAFLPKGTLVVSTKGQTADAKKEFLTTPQDYQVVREDAAIAKLPAITKTMPIVVLVNGASASASEIVAGALQDHKRATIMGTKSFGKGSVQTVIPLRGEAKGISPDVEVKDTAEGNFLDLDIREADLANHLEVPETKDDKAKAAKPAAEAKPDASGIKETVEPISSKPKKAPKFYKYGDPDDYQLNQAIAYLKKEDAKKNQSAAGTQEIQLEGGIKMKIEPVTSQEPSQNNPASENPRPSFLGAKVIFRGRGRPASPDRQRRPRRLSLQISASGQG